MIIKTSITKRNIFLNIVKNKFYFTIFLLGLSILLSAPIFVSKVIIPAFKSEILHNIVDESKRVALHLSNSIDFTRSVDDIDKQINIELTEFKIEKIHYFDKIGKVLYSTARDNIGTLNSKPYFHNIVAKGEVYYKIDHKGNTSADGELVSTDMIEIYIPLLEQGKFQGAFELYYNITEEEKKFSVLSRNVTLSNILISFILGVIMFIMLYNASKNSIKKEEVLLYNLNIQDKLKNKTHELLETNDDLNNSIANLAKTQQQLMESQKIANTARKNAEDANREKSMFLANISHELKTPLNGISGLVYLSKLKVSDNEIKRNLTNIQNYSETLSRMISDLLDSSKIDAKKINVELSDFNLNDMLESIRQLYSMQCSEKNIDFVLNYDENIPKNLRSDPIRLHQVITNLLNNAIKFTHKGSVRLDVEIQSQDEKNVKIKFRIKDDGIGIKETELKNIFKPFYQTKESLTYYAGGSGLGLNICQKIVEHLEGVIWADSKKETGSTFFVLLDFEILEEKEERNDKLSFLNNNNKVLVVDDNSINQDILVRILESENISSDVASNGLEALTLLEDNDYSLVLTDINMPGMDGWELSKNIRNIYTYDELPIIIISANTKEETEKYLEDFAVNSSIEKPINPVSFLQELSKFIDYKKKTNIIVSNQVAFVTTLDIKSALHRFVNNKSLYKNTLKIFLNEYSNSMTKIKELLKKQDIKELLDYLHTIKGVSANLSAIKFSEVTRTLHDAIKYGKKYNFILKEYEEELNNLKNEIDAYLISSKKKEELDLPINSNLNLEDKEKILLDLLKYSKEHSPEGIHLYRGLSASVKKDIFLSKLEYDVLNYNFKNVEESIERYLKENTK